MTATAGTSGPAPPPPGRRLPSAPVQPGPAGTRVGAVCRLPAFWLIVALLVTGGVRMSAVLHQSFTAYPAATATAVALFTLYAVPFWLVFRELDYLEREPPVLLALAFAWGGVVATSVSIPGTTAVHNLLAKLGSTQLAAVWGPAIAAPSVEELAKASGIAALVLIGRGQINSVLDGMVYGALVGLGFQVVEDIVFAVGAVAVAGRGDHLEPVVATFFLRGFLAGLWSHTMFSTLAGAGIGYLVVRVDRTLTRRLAVAAFGLAGAWASHFLWNSPLLLDGLGDGPLALLAVLLIKGVPPLLTVGLLIRRAHGREAEYYARQLAALHDPRLATPAELRALSSGARRAHARRHAHQRAGWRGRHTVRRLQRSQARLAVELSRSAAPASAGAALDRPGLDRAGAVQGGGADDALGRCRAELLALRGRLVALGHPEAVAPDSEHGPWRRAAGTFGGALLALAVVWAAITALGGG